MNASLARPHKQRVQTASVEAFPTQTAYRPVPEATALLTEILARLHDVEVPIVQFVPACPATGLGRVTRDFGVAAVARHGRTLLLSSRCNEGDVKLAPVRRRVSAAAASTTPDASIPGLYYKEVDELPGLLMQAGGPAARSFKLVVVLSGSPSCSPATLSCARHCSGSVITVAAGVTRAEALQATERQLRQVGATVLGTVLFDAPRMHLPFLGRAA